MSNNLAKGYWLAAASILLATYAQLAMKWGMSHLSINGDNWRTLEFFLNAKLEIGLVFSGLFAYFLSTVTWLGALTQMPLNKAYPILSISYALVYLLTIFLPWFNESFSLLKTCGVILICFGVLLVVSSPNKSQ